MNNKIKEAIRKYDKDFVKNTHWYTLITRCARNYIVFAEKVDGISRAYGWRDKEFLNGYSIIKRIDMKILENDFTKTIWHFKTIKNDYGKIGYIVSSNRDCLESQVSKETYDIIYQMIIEKSKEISNSKIIIEEIF